LAGIRLEKLGCANASLQDAIAQLPIFSKTRFCQIQFPEIGKSYSEVKKQKCVFFNAKLNPCFSLPGVNRVVFPNLKKDNVEILISKFYQFLSSQKLPSFPKK